ncbi:MAG: MFS transporter [Firmicutes bacterium]|nr:MFS transporter [Bacillota bacterium]
MYGQAMLFMKWGMNMEKKIYKSLLKHSFWGNFDSGVIFIFLSFYIWDKTENMITIALAFAIPIIINTVFDYYFSDLSDKKDRIKLIIIGNIGSAVFLSLYGLAGNIYLLYFFIFFKSLFAKLYQSSLAPYKRDTINEKEYKGYISKENIKISVGASIGGFSLMYVYLYTKNIPLIFIISGLIELYSTIYLFKLQNIKQKKRKEREDHTDLNWLKKITLIYTIEGFAIALIINRMIIFLHDVHKIKIQDVGFIFFIVYGISNIVAARIYDKFKRISLKNMFIISFLFQAILLILFTKVYELKVIVGIWFIFELISNITDIYSRDKINRSLFTSIGKRLSKFRISIALGSILGQVVVSQIWDRIGVNESFYFSSIVLIILSIIIAFNKKRKLKIQ